MDVVTLGESMVLMTPQQTGYMRYAEQFSAKVAGAETNVAIGLKRLGHDVCWISRLGHDEFGEKIFRFIRGEGVDTAQITWDETHPTGLYFKEALSSESVRVQYYRKGSAASQLTPEHVSERYISQAKYLHITGITPALSDSCRQAVLKAIAIARQHGVTVVFDPNLRKKLWSDDKAREVLLDIVAKADIVMPGQDEAAFLLGQKDVAEMATDFLAYGPSKVVIKLGADGAYYADDRHQDYISGFAVEHVVDPVGAGDGFAAGFVSGLLDHLSLAEAVRRGAGMGALVTMVPGDMEGLPERQRLLSFMEQAHHEDVMR